MDSLPENNDSWFREDAFQDLDVENNSKLSTKFRLLVNQLGQQPPNTAGKFKSQVNVNELRTTPRK